MSSKLREALNQLLGLIDNEILVFSNGLDPSEVSNAQYQIDKADEALAEPPRNCDVGTAKEQHERHLKFCDEHARYMRCSQCPAGSNNIVTCHFTWMQMPYEEGGAK